jgi:hypothetical protein
MKALISPNETFTHTWVTEWILEGTRIATGGTVNEYSTVTSTVENCIRVADVAEVEFDVAEPLFWVDCANDCTRDNSYYKDGVVYKKPISLERPE